MTTPELMFLLITGEVMWMTTAAAANDTMGYCRYASDNTLQFAIWQSETIHTTDKNVTVCDYSNLAVSLQLDYGIIYLIR